MIVVELRHCIHPLLKKEIISSYDSSLVATSGSAEGLPEVDFGETLDAIVDPLLQMCELSVGKFGKVDRDIYLVNCIHHIEVCKRVLV